MSIKPVKDVLRLSLPVLPVRGVVVFPRQVLYFDVSRQRSIAALEHAMEADQQVLLLAQRDIMDNDPNFDALYKVGVIAKLRQILKLPDGNTRIIADGVGRAMVVNPLGEQPFMSAEIDEYPLASVPARSSLRLDALIRTAKELFDEYVALVPKISKDIVTNIMTNEDAEFLSDYITASIMLKYTDKQKILEESSIQKRFELLVGFLKNENSILALERDIFDKVKDQISESQRENFLREQQRAISRELGEGDDLQNDILSYRLRIEAFGLEEETREKLLAETNRLARMSSHSPDASIIRNYLDFVLELPWDKLSRDRIDIDKAKKQLDRDHFGLMDVKERILEFLAVRSLVPDINGQIICLVGPPGVGKTSIASSIAKSMNRKFHRLALGGVRDESEIRGHRKTYLGAMPGRIISAMKTTGVKNPLILLDEIDKLANDMRGDPASALLEVLDSEQNHSFKDHYLDVPFDLGQVLFIATANSVDTIPPALRDRMELIFLTSYTREEKFNIAKKHLVKKQTKKHGLTPRQLTITDEAIYTIIDNYTREAGVRSFERTIAKLCRIAAKKLVSGDTAKLLVNDKNIEELLGPRKYTREELAATNEVGLVNGLAYTSVGGELLQIEVSILDGSGKIELTGSLGSVMKESASTAISYIRSRCEILGIDKDFYKTKDIHIHCPEGATPKDGPSAGITMATALISALTGTPARRDVAMTGEVTLRGRVLPIGGLKEKTMAAYRAGIKTVIIPKDNASDLAKLDSKVRESLEFIPVDSMDSVIPVALCGKNAQAASAGQMTSGYIAEERVPVVI